MKKTKLLCGFLVMIALFSFAACSQKAQQPAQQAATAPAAAAPAAAAPATAAPQIIRLGYTSTENPEHPVTIAAYALRDYINEKSNGRFDVRLFPGSQLGSGVQMFEMTQMGTLDMTIPGIPNMPMFTDALGGMDMPYIFRGNYDLMYKALSGPAGKEMLANMEKDTGVKALGYGFHVWLHFFMRNKPILSLADCRGQKLRVMESPVQQDIYSALGFSPVAVSLPDLYQALNQGTVDGLAFDMIGGITEKYYEIIKHVTKSGHICFASVLVMSNKLFSSLSPDDQKIFLDAGAFAEQKSYTESVRLESKYEQQLKDHGVQIHEIDLNPFYAAMQPVIDRYCAKSPRIKAFVDAVNAMR